MKQTAVEWLVKNTPNIYWEDAYWADLFERAKQREKQQKGFSDEDMIEASKYGYNFHKTTQFPNQEFEDSCIRNTQQWVVNLKTNKI